jgi:hypothetical protein
VAEASSVIAVVFFTWRRFAVSAALREERATTIRSDAVVPRDDAAVDVVSGVP